MYCASYLLKYYHAHYFIGTSQPSSEAGKGGVLLVTPTGKQGQRSEVSWPIPQS